jgi:hypothetical protein
MAENQNIGKSPAKRDGSGTRLPSGPELVNQFGVSRPADEFRLTNSRLTLAGSFVALAP